MRAWLVAAELVEGPLFVGLTPRGGLRPTAIGDRMVAHVVKRRCKAVGIDPSEVAGQPLLCRRRETILRPSSMTVQSRNRPFSRIKASGKASPPIRYDSAPTPAVTSMQLRQRVDYSADEGFTAAVTRVVDIPPLEARRFVRALPLVLDAHMAA